MTLPKDDLVEPAIAAIAPYEPGKPIEELQRELGQSWGASDPIKLASNENPYGPSPLGIAAAQQGLRQGHLYPDGAAYALRHALAKHLGVRFDQIVVGSGSNEIVDLLVQAFCSEDDEVLATQYSFIAYKLAAEKNRRAFREATPGPRLGCDVDALLAAVNARTKIVFLANPNNPTGVYLPRADFEHILERLPPRVLLVVDEAYYDYVRESDYPHALQYLERRERIVVLRTFSKIYGLAGLRVGYAIAAPRIIDYVNRVRLPFNVSVPAQAAALAALEDTAHTTRSRQGNDVELPKLTDGLRALGLEVLPSQTNFVLVDCAGRDAAQLYQQLLHKGIIVRPVRGYGLPHHLRITVGRADENLRLLVGLEEIL